MRPCPRPAAQAEARSLCLPGRRTRSNMDRKTVPKSLRRAPREHESRARVSGSRVPRRKRGVIPTMMDGRSRPGFKDEGEWSKMRVAYPMRVDALDKPGGDVVLMRTYIQQCAG